MMGLGLSSLGLGQYQTSGGVGPETFAKWNSADKTSAMALSNDDRTFTRSSGSGEEAIRGVTSLEGANYYWEIEVPVQNNGSFGIRLATDSIALNASNGVTFSWRTNGQIFASGMTANFSNGPSYGNGTVLKFAMNPTSRKIWIGLVGSAWFNSGDPAADTNSAVIAIPAGIFKPYAWLDNNTTLSSGILRSGSMLNETPPTGFISLPGS
jgi:hypothetical protein